ncbi:MAG: FixH family protein [Phycisphaeraceae bacterium]|nr:FixH family protein [Phycisphaerales bacterium]MCB9842848.1 FixH family protein [Phycisphaeraceae bacterium]
MMKSPFFWFGLVALIMGVDFAAFGYLIARSSNDPTFAVEESYYEKGLDWDTHMAQERRNAELGWRVAARVGEAGAGVRELVLTVVDRDARAVGGALIGVEVFANVRASEKHELSGVTDGAGVCVVRVPDGVPGVWEARVRVTAGTGRLFTETVRFEMPEGEGARP